MAYLLGRGPVYIGNYTGNGSFGAVEKFHAPDFEIDTSEAERLTHTNTNGLIAVDDLDILLKITGKANIKIDTAAPSVLAMAVGGEVTDTPTGGTFTNKIFPNPVVVGKQYPIPGGYSNLASLVMTDSTGSPVTLTLGTHYTVDLAAGLITIVSLTSLTQPLKAAGAEANSFSAISIATKDSTEKFVRLCGANIAGSDKVFNVDLYRAKFPTAKVAAKTSGSEVAVFEFGVTLLADESAPFDKVFGQLGRMVQAY
jgi:hypothetical protein